MEGKKQNKTKNKNKNKNIKPFCKERLAVPRVDAFAGWAKGKWLNLRNCFLLTSGGKQVFLWQGEGASDALRRQAALVIDRHISIIATCGPTHTHHRAEKGPPPP